MIDNYSNTPEAEAQAVKGRAERISQTINDFVRDGRLPLADAPTALARALEDEAYLDRLAMRPHVPANIAPTTFAPEVKQEYRSSAIPLAPS